MLGAGSTFALDAPPRCLSRLRMISEPPSIVVVNPNASTTMTRAIEEAVGSMATPDLSLRCVTLEDGPAGVESHEDFARAARCVTAFVKRSEQRAAGFVIACFSDPGLAEARRVTSRPVVGIQEAAVTEALISGDRFGIVALVEASVERQLRALASMGALPALAAARPLGIRVAELWDRATTWPRLVEVATRLRDEDGAERILLGCAGMGAYRAELEALLELPVADPCRAGVALARGRVTRSASDPLRSTR